MKKLVIIIILLLFTNGLWAQNNYYWHKGKKNPLTEITGKKYILYEDNSSISQLKEIINISGSRFIKNERFYFSKSIHPYKKKQQNGQNWAILEYTDTSQLKLSNLSQIAYESSFYLTESGDEVGLSHLFYVKLKNSEDTVILEKTAIENNLKIEGLCMLSPSWYILSCTKNSNGDALKMANLFYETGLFSSAQPDLMPTNMTLCTNDTCFSDQWGLKNTGQYGGTTGIDINFCQSSNITKGDQEIIIAILDDGFEMNHPDLTNVHSLSWDTRTGTSPAQVRGSHGTACAGIIGAGSNNVAGISGISPDCQIMSISNIIGSSPTLLQERADGINFAWHHGASILNCSWHSTAQFEPLEEAIDSALNYGRNGLGTVIVFAAGNTNSYPVNYPASYNDDILVVWAIDPCGKRKSYNSCEDQEEWGSSYGSKLDIMAPGVLIPTTDRQSIEGYNPYDSIHPNYEGTLLEDDYSNEDYTIWFTGTSAACPHVAAVAGLILSLDPTLTQHEVADIIESTAQKVGGYEYGTSATRPNGTWNTYMGYGLLDAHAAVLEACLTTEFFDQIIVHNTTIEGCNIDIQNVEVKNNSNFTIEAGNEVTIIGDFEVELGSELEIY